MLSGRPITAGSNAICTKSGKVEVKILRNRKDFNIINRIFVLAGFGDQSTAATVDYSILNHEKDVLLEKTKAQENEIMSLRLKVEAFEKDKQVI